MLSETQQLSEKKSSVDEEYEMEEEWLDIYANSDESTINLELIQPSTVANNQSFRYHI